MPDDEVTEGAAKPVSMDDLKLMETSLRSSMEAQMESIKIMLSGLMPVEPLWNQWLYHRASELLSS